MIVTLFGITVITFIVTRLTPGEPAPVSAESFGSDSAGGYDSLLELNRRNLGLDKPMLVNFNFEDRDFKAEEAARDFIRPAGFWKDIGETNLRLATTIAVPHVLTVLNDLKNASGKVNHLMEQEPDPKQQIDIEQSIDRLLGILPELALTNERPQSNDVSSQIEFWENWWESNKNRFEEQNVEQSIDEFVNGDRGAATIRQLGGFAIPYLLDGLDDYNDDARLLKINNALNSLTGFSYLSAPENWEEEKPRVIGQWESFYSRESIRYETYNGFQHSINIISNTQFGVWFWQIVTLDFGDSYQQREPVLDLIKRKLPVTLVLSFLSIIFSYIISIPIGILSAVKKKTGTDSTITVALFVLYSLPTFWTAQVLLLSLTGGPSPWGGEWPNVFPTRGLNSEGLDWTSGDPKAIMDLFWHLVLPVFCMTYGSLAFLSRQMRSSVLETIKDDYIRTARAKGLNERTVILKHAVRNSLIPIITISAGLLPELIAGSIVIESIFNIPGMGLLSFDAILSRDYPVINAILFFSAALTLVGILIADLAYVLVDPRISYK